jgi:AcrR family transcriptional regulator
MPRPALYDRNESLGKALDLFWSKGYYASSLKQIEKALDMRPASIYSAFGNKDLLYIEALTIYGEAGLLELDRHVEQYESVIGALKDYLRLIADSCCDKDGGPARACLIVKTMLETNNTHTDLSLKAREYLDKFEAKLQSFLELSKQRGELVQETDCKRLARVLQAQIIAIRAMAERQLEHEAIKDLGNDMARILDCYRS